MNPLIYSLRITQVRSALGKIFRGHSDVAALAGLRRGSGGAREEERWQIVMEERAEWGEERAQREELRAQREGKRAEREGERPDWEGERAEWEGWRVEWDEEGAFIWSSQVNVLDRFSVHHLQHRGLSVSEFTCE